MTEQVTLGEIARNVTAAREDLAKVQASLDTRPDWEDVKRVERGLETKFTAGDMALDAKLTALETATKTKDTLQDLAISKLEGWGNWATKAVGGVIIAAVLVRSGMG